MFTLRFISFTILILSYNVFIQHTFGYRLPNEINPINYDIEITPYFQQENAFTFNGNVKITFRPLFFINRVVLNVKNLIINSNSLQRAGELVSTTATNFEYANLTEQYTLNYLQTINPSYEYTLTLYYIGNISTDMNGFYRSSYADNNQTKWMGATQLQPTYARRVFPCFDEPRFKSTFKLTMNRPDTFQPTISNTHIVSVQYLTGIQRVQEVFASTPRMSTYLLGFVVSEFIGNTSTTSNFSVYVRPDAIAQVQYSLNFGENSLTQLSKYLLQPYYTNDMLQMSMVAIPDFEAGAMENWGLLTYRESALLYDPQESDVFAEQRIATIVVHEQSHMWFGNSVTCEWWSHLWLNEGFARYFQYFGTAMVKPEWDLPLQYVVEQIHSVLVIDSMEYTHPLTQHVETPFEIASMFDSISYNKGSAIIRMIEHLLGPERFRTVLQTYLKERQYNTVVTSDLERNILNQMTNNEWNLNQFLNTWTTQSGYPFLIVELQNSTTNVKVSQRRFYIKNLNQADQTKWDIPITYALNSNDFQNTVPKLLLMNTSQEPTIIELGKQIDWIVFNVQQTGYYRVFYDSILWNKLKDILNSNKFEEIHVINRAQIIDDVMNFARSGMINYDFVFSILNYLEREEHYLPWLTALNNWDILIRNLNATYLIDANKFILKLTRNVYQQLTFQESFDDTRLDLYNRINILSYICKYGHRECIQKSREEFSKLLNDRNYKIQVNLRPIIYCTAIAEGGHKEWDFLWRKYKVENVATEQSVILKSLGCSREKNQTIDYLNKIFSVDVRLQDKLFAVKAVYNGYEDNVLIVLDYIIDNYQNLSMTTSMIAHILQGLSERFTTNEQVDILKIFLTNHEKDFIGNNRIANAIADVQYFFKWATENQVEIANQLQLHSSSLRMTVFNVLLGFLILISYYI